VRDPAEPPVLPLDDARASDVALCGAKAANLAAAAKAGMPTQPGFVVTTGAYQQMRDAGSDATESGLASVLAQIRPHWAELSGDGRVSLVVRSSSPVEDASTTSLAGHFRSVLDVRGWDAFVRAVADVQDSADLVESGAGTDPVQSDAITDQGESDASSDGHDQPEQPEQPTMAVLVQPFLRPECAGVLFGLDPVTGDADRLVVEAVAGGPEKLVSGKVAAQHYVLTRRGTPRAVDHQRPRRRWGRDAVDNLLNRRDLRHLATLAETAAEAFGSPQDIEWAKDSAGTIWLLQSRPVTATGSASLAEGPILGPGPIAETFPEPLRPLEADLWLTPMAEGIRHALSSTRAVAPSRLAKSPVLTLVHGRPAADLGLFGYGGRQQSAWRLLDPRAAGRRLRAAWHVGWLRTSLAERATAVVNDMDIRLAAVPPLGTMDDEELVRVLREAIPLLEGLHRDEALAGSLLPAEATTAAAVALDVLDRRRRSGVPDDDVVRRDPVVLALLSPRIGAADPLPPTSSSAVLGTHSPGAVLGPREGLRLRARWVQELTTRAALTLGGRLADRGLLGAVEDVALLRLAELENLTAGRVPVPPDLPARHATALADLTRAPLPARFRLTPAGEVAPVARPRTASGSGVGAGGGRGTGPVRHGSPANPPLAGEVLLVRTLDPRLAPFLPGLAGVVAESGSTLSHLAIVARESGVPIVVAVPDALQRFPPGTCVLVDGTTGEVSLVGESPAPRKEVVR
jgi:phosphohistidine swiveling domain-containing protein